MSGEVAQVIARAPDGAASVEPGRHPATQQVALQITRALDQDRTEIRIRLDPPELGEVDIQLEFRDLRLTAAISAERSDTLELLQRDSRALTRALREAGLELADSDLSFAHSGRNDRPDTGATRSARSTCRTRLRPPRRSRIGRQPLRVPTDSSPWATAGWICASELCPFSNFPRLRC